ncbi:TadE/TadG family type IV pilus assembly protein [Novosphingobium sp.]|uniref:TadE/TadG family type IV pilus assembly protein n=1 Tax=Novosphingobium sp. TaxID=1874826 RepID=UPI003FA5BCC1
MRVLRSFLCDQRGSTAAEFALVLPVALLFLLGIIDVGRYAWTFNRLEKAVQMGTRYAVATSVVPGGLNTKNDFVGITCNGKTLGPGDPIACTDAIGTISCTGGASVSCTCAATTQAKSCTGLPGTVNTTAFTDIVSRMQVILPSIQPTNVTVKYSGSGIGYAGDPSGLSQVAPVVTVQVASVAFRALVLFGGSVSLPAFSYSQTLEDGDGAVAY